MLIRGILLIGSALLVSGASATQSPQSLFNQAVRDFSSGRIEESVAGFNALIKLQPKRAPYLWQRGIALYYAGQYRECQDQFESHQIVNPNDVENAAWHFLCVARADSLEVARARLLPVGPDSRVSMREIYEMFQGVRSPDNILAVDWDDPRSRFYAELYAGLYFEILGNRTQALRHLTVAAADRFAKVGGYMHMVTRVHLAVRIQ